MITIIRFLVVVLALIAQPAMASMSGPIEPRQLTWNIVSDAEMSKICRQHGLRANCEGMAAWDREFRSCIIWTRSPRGSDDLARWRLVHHELQHCQNGHFHRR
jgi:hypothetical protein